MSDTYFITGALGCIGAWVVKHLAERGDQPVVYDLGGDPRRIRDILAEDDFARVRFVEGDITDGAAVKDAVVADLDPAVVARCALVGGHKKAAVWREGDHIRARTDRYLRQQVTVRIIEPDRARIGDRIGGG